MVGVLDVECGGGGGEERQSTRHRHVLTLLLTPVLPHKQLKKCWCSCLRVLPKSLPRPDCLPSDTAVTSLARQLAEPLLAGTWLRLSSCLPLPTFLPLLARRVYWKSVYYSLPRPSHCTPTAPPQLCSHLAVPVQKHLALLHTDVGYRHGALNNTGVQANPRNSHRAVCCCRRRGSSKQHSSSGTGAAGVYTQSAARCASHTTLARPVCAARLRIATARSCLLLCGDPQVRVRLALP